MEFQRSDDQIISAVDLLWSVIQNKKHICSVTEVGGIAALLDLLWVKPTSRVQTQILRCLCDACDEPQAVDRLYAWHRDKISE